MINYVKVIFDMKDNLKAFIIIDGYSSTSALINLLSERSDDYQFIHIITPSLVKICLQLNYPVPTHNVNYVSEYIYDGNYLKLKNFLSKWIIIEIVCGVETEGIELRDLLAKDLNLSTQNEITTSICRRNKFFMVEKLKEKGLAHIKQFLLTSKEDILAGMEYITNFPMVIKPLDSGMSDGFTVCNNKISVDIAFDKLFNKKNLFKRVNKKLLLQEYISGEEYAINAISYLGKVYITDIWHYKNQITPDGRRICLYALLIHQTDTVLISYVNKCLDALGYKNGPSHTEVIVHKDQPVMLESGARLMGSLPNFLLNECLDTTQAEALATYMVSPDKLSSLQLGLKKHLMLVNVVSENKSGYLTKIHEWNEVKLLPSFREFILLVKEGIWVDKAAQQKDCLARIILINEDMKQLNADYEYINQQAHNYFEIS